jgi:hypothetical protein
LRIGAQGPEVDAPGAVLKRDAAPEFEGNVGFDESTEGRDRLAARDRNSE